MFEGKYQSSPSRANPGCILFVLDQSFSMNEGIAGSSRPKAEALATAINRFLNDLIIRCERGEDKPRHYFDIGVFGYTTTQSDPPVTLVGPVLQGELAVGGRGIGEKLAEEEEAHRARGHGPHGFVLLSRSARAQ